MDKSVMVIIVLLFCVICVVSMLVISGFAGSGTYDVIDYTNTKKQMTDLVSRLTTLEDLLNGTTPIQLSTDPSSNTSPTFIGPCTSPAGVACATPSLASPQNIIAGLTQPIQLYINAYGTSPSS